MLARTPSLRRILLAASVLAMPILLGNDGCYSSSTVPTVGALCGGVAGTECGPGLYCDHAAADASGVDGQGRCATRPDATACILLYAPVCGLDGITYSNDCFAAAAGASVVHDGECEPDVEGCLAIYDPVCGTDGVT